jgi:hypothetical protein
MLHNMTDYNLIEGLAPYEFADEAVWDNQRLRSTAKVLFEFLKTNVPIQAVPEEILLDGDQALLNMTFELKMRRNEASTNK